MAGPITTVQRMLRRARTEAAATVENRRLMPLSRQLALWRRGFYSSTAHFYDFDRYGPDAYVSDMQRSQRLGGINQYPHLLDDKLSFALYMQALGAPTPRVHAVAHQGHIGYLGAPEDLTARIRDAGSLVVRSRLGSGGKAVVVLRWDGERVLVGATPVPDPTALLRRGRFVVTDFVQQHPYASSIFPHSGNTLRVLTMRDPATEEHFAALATHRFGTSASGAADNFSQGGISAGVGLATGEVTEAVAKVDRGRGLVRLQVHPETQAPIAGVRVPHFRDVVARLERLATEMPGFDFVGWDVMVTESGFSILEANNRSDTVLQVHGPLLLDERVRRFMDAYGVRQRSGPTPPRGRARRWHGSGQVPVTAPSAVPASFR